MNSLKKLSTLNYYRKIIPEMREIKLLLKNAHVHSAKYTQDYLLKN